MPSTIESQIRFSKGTKQELAATLAWLERQGYKRAAMAIMTRLCISPEELASWHALSARGPEAPAATAQEAA